MKDVNADSKKQAILTAAFGQFATYGFRKTSMDDIALAAGMSRPALYLHYRNKVDIYRSLVEKYYEQLDTGLRAILTSHDDPVQILTEAFDHQGAMIADVLLNTAHGRELLESTNTAAADLVDHGEAQVSLIYSEWLASGEANGKLQLPGPAADVARTITGALKGIKTNAPDATHYVSGLRHLAQMVGAGLAK